MTTHNIASLLICPICGQDTGVAVSRRMQELPSRMRDSDPCEECQEHMSIGFLLVERDKNVITGHRWVLSKESDFYKALPDEFTKLGVAYITPEDAKNYGMYDVIAAKEED